MRWPRGRRWRRCYGRAKRHPIEIRYVASGTAAAYREASLEPDDYAQELNAQLTYLISFARSMNELDLAGALFGEFRGAQDAGWNASATAFEVFEELRSLGTKAQPLTIAEFRQVLCLYAQLAEAGGVYEGLANLFGVIQLKPYSMWPFHEMVQVREAPRRVVGPNANAVFRRLAETARAIGMTKFSSLLEVTFRDDIRNGIFHADYIISPQDLRLRRRNGGQALALSMNEVNRAISIGMMFFELLIHHQAEARQAFRPARVINGRFSANPPMDWTVELHADGHFSIQIDRPGPHAAPSYHRQQAINDRLGGRVLAAYVVGGDDTAAALISQIAALGFEPVVVAFDDQGQLDALRAEVTAGGLWADAHDAGGRGTLMATPFGFSAIATVEAFQTLLPEVEPLEIVMA